MLFLKSINHVSRPAVAILISGLLSACGAHIPVEIKQPVKGSPAVEQVYQHVDDYLSQKVRWGGVILQTENKHNASELTIIALPLNKEGKPQSSDHSPGRFIAIIDEFVEPLVYSPEREITVTGKILRTETRKVGEFPYEYPLIKVEHYHLWPVKVEPAYYDYPAYPLYDPFYYPLHYPYYSPYRRHH